MLVEIFTFIVLVIIGAYFLRRVLETQQLNNLGDLPVAITGCDSGFGYNLALKCIRNGMPVFAACLTQTGIDRLIEEANGIPNGENLLNCFQMDVSDDESVAKGVKFVEEKLKGSYKGLFALVNNAGISSATVFDEMCSLNDYHQAWNVNTLGVIRVTHAFIRIVKPMRGRIIIMASICGRVGFSGLGPYTVSKFAVEGYGDVLRAEMSIFGVKVIIMEPGFFKTSLASYDRVGQSVNEHWERLPGTLKAEYGKALFDYQTRTLLTTLQNASSDTEVANDAYFHALTARWPRPRYHVGVDANFMFIPFATLPTAVQDCYLWVNALVSGRPRPAAAVQAVA